MKGSEKKEYVKEKACFTPLKTLLKNTSPIARKAEESFFFSDKENSNPGTSKKNISKDFYFDISNISVKSKHGITRQNKKNKQVKIYIYIRSTSFLSVYVHININCFYFIINNNSHG